MLMTPNIISLAIVEMSILSLSLYAIFYAIKIARYWDFDATSTRQYTLEKNSFLVSLVIFFVACIKIMILPYFVYVIDSLSGVIVGAMCGVGVIGANEYGVILLSIKIVSVLIAGFWLVIHHIDILSRDYRYMRLKIYMFFVLFILILFEDLLYINYFFGIRFDSVVECCSVIFSTAQSTSKIPYGIDVDKLVMIFGISSILLYVSIRWRYYYIVLFMSIFYIFVSMYTIIYAFSPYVYELPTHQCPFCLFQQEYLYIGYIVFSSLFGATFLAIYHSIIFLLFGIYLQQIKRLSLVLLYIFIFVLIFYPLQYYIKNGVLL